MGRFRRDRLAIRSLQWGQFVVVVARGALNANTGDALKNCVLEIQGAQPVILDLWDVPRCDLAGVSAVRDVKQLLEERAWALAVVADPSGPCAEALGEGPSPIEIYANRRAARTALHHAAL